jgi:preprotein translocase subunit YajC
MTIEQLLGMNRVICRRSDQLQYQENMQALSQLREGSKVIFNGTRGPTVGIVTKINYKSVIVLAEDNGMKQ